jgi:maleamate amidohydrolase
MRIPERYREERGPAWQPAARVGYGERSALLIVDMIKAITDPKGPLARDLAREITAINQLLEVARRIRLPVIFSTSMYDPALQEAGIWTRKASGVLRHLIEGTEWVEVDERLGRQPDEMLLVKKYSSCFFGTDLVSRLVSRKIDTVIVVGTRTSTCIRATVVDACSYGFHVIVVQDAVVDPSEFAHYANLIDIDARYADVVELDEALSYLGSLELQTVPS